VKTLFAAHRSLSAMKSWLGHLSRPKKAKPMLTSKSFDTAVSASSQTSRLNFFDIFHFSVFLSFHRPHNLFLH
jgi:hypothetical protein